MLQITIPKQEGWDERTQEFVDIKEQTLQLEHSLISLSKWESKWHKVFLSNKDDKTLEQTIDYIKCMTLTQNVKPEVYDRLTEEHFEIIKEYIDNPMTATYFSNMPGGKKSSEQVTSELIYYWMISCNIPFECEKWHLNRLITLIKVCDIKNQPPKKRSKRDIASQYAKINAARRQQLNSKG